MMSFSQASEEHWLRAYITAADDDTESLKEGVHGSVIVMEDGGYAVF
jgi:hypothetical protein